MVARGQHGGGSRYRRSQIRNSESVIRRLPGGERDRPEGAQSNIRNPRYETGADRVLIRISDFGFRICALELRIHTGGHGDRVKVLIIRDGAESDAAGSDVVVRGLDGVEQSRAIAVVEPGGDG